MIQRIQSLFLLIVIALAALLFFIPVFTTTAAGATNSENYYITDSNGLLIVNSAIIILSLATILTFKKREWQKKMCNLNLILICVLTGLLFFLADSMGKGVHYVVGSYFPLLMLVFTFFAMRGIKKDDQLVRSADRLRP